MFCAATYIEKSFLGSLGVIWNYAFLEQLGIFYQGNVKVESFLPNFTPCNYIQSGAAFMVAANKNQKDFYLL